MNKRILAVFLALALALSGCQLAVEDTGESSSVEDRLVGVLLTEERLNLIDMEAYLNDNLDQVLNGETWLEGDASAYSGRIYAVKKEETVTNEKGQTHTVISFEFEDVEGYLLSTFLCDSNVDPSIMEGDEYWSFLSDEPFCDLHNGIHISDDGEKNTIEGTIYMDENHGEVLFYKNPVYQTNDGRIYVTECTVGSFHCSQGGNITSTISQTNTHTVNGEKSEYSMEVSVSLKPVQISELVRLLHMSESNEVLLVQEYEPDELPEEIIPAEGAAYLICEEHVRDEEGELTVTRQIHDAKSDPISVFQRWKGDICIKRELNILWDEA